jgi:hypothetical protein
MNSEKVVLLVEDKVEITDMIEALWRRKKIQGILIIARSIDDVYKYIIGIQRIEMIFWDNEIRNGEEVIQTNLISQAIKLHPECRMVAMSSNLENLQVQRDQGCTIPLPKPFQVAEFLDVLSLVFPEVVK